MYLYNVEDMIIAGHNQEVLVNFKVYLGKCFKMKDLDTLNYFLGLEISRSSRVIFMSQRKYDLDINTESSLFGARPVDFPMEQHHQLATTDVEKYRRLMDR